MDKLNKTKKRVYYTALAVIVSLVAGTGMFFMAFFSSNVSQGANECLCLVKETQSAETIFEANSIGIKSMLSWRFAARLKNQLQVKPGRYCLREGMSNNEIIKEFRSGGAATLSVRIDDVSSLEELAGKLGRYFLRDSTSFMQGFTNDSLVRAVGFDPQFLATGIRPNTYEFYWNMGTEAFLKKMKNESTRMWTTERMAQANEISMSTEEVVILASIVKAETSATEEAPRIAGLYINRLRTGMPLQSDPTALFGRRKLAQRVYLSDLQNDSPYNTYKIQGLPPGPINFPETVYIDAVLTAEKNNYIFMCAEPGGTGRHRFARSLSEHERNRSEYVRWLNKSGIQ